jgi:hypothetical protein
MQPALRRVRALTSTLLATATLAVGLVSIQAFPASAIDETAPRAVTTSVAERSSPSGRILPTTHTPVSLGAGGCGFLQACIYLNRRDQRAVISGGAAGVAAAICFIPGVGQAGCVVAVSLIAISSTYLGDHGLCPHRLRIRIFPWPGNPGCL